MFNIKELMWCPHIKDISMLPSFGTRSSPFALIAEESKDSNCTSNSDTEPIGDGDVNI
jgi:hypothetical protein